MDQWHWCSARRDHPREYGENNFCAAASPGDDGSSPRILGKSANAGQRGRGWGIIPANTGKIYVPRSCATTWWDHPREYGENEMVMMFSAGMLGSSPRIRGKRFACGCAGSGTGIIPANTGKTQPGITRFCSTRDHPREYGENVALPQDTPFALGSSPRIRGEFTAAAFWCLVSGIIPANTGRILRLARKRTFSSDHPREYGENLSVQHVGSCGFGIIPANTGRMTARR